MLERARSPCAGTDAHTDAASSPAFQPFTIDAPAWLIMRQRLLHYLSNGGAIKFPCKWVVPHFILIYGILIEFVSPNWKILLFNVCIAVAVQGRFNEIVSQWPWGRKRWGWGVSMHALDSAQQREIEGGWGQRSCVARWGRRVFFFFFFLLNWWEGQIHQFGVWCCSASKHCDWTRRASPQIVTAESWKQHLVWGSAIAAAAENFD